MKVKFKELSLKNFMSFGNRVTTIPLDTDVLTLIMGKNFDSGESGHSKNGVGKSSVFQAIVWCLYGDGINTIKQDDFVNIINRKKMHVTLELEIDGQNYTITRGRKPAILEILHNGNPWTLHSSATNDDAIETLIGLDKDIFMTTIMLSSNVTPFMDQKPTPQKNFIERLLDLHKLAERIKMLKIKSSDNDVDLKLEEQNKHNHQIHYEKTLGRIKSVQDKLDQWDLTNTYDISRLEDDLLKLQSIDVDEQKSAIQRNRDRKTMIDQFQSKIREYESEQKADESDYDIQLKSDINEIRSLHTEERKHIRKLREEEMSGFNEEREIYTNDRSALKDAGTDIKSFLNQLKSDKRQAKQQKTKLQTELDALLSGKCPYCDSVYSSEDKIEEIRKEISVIGSLDDFDVEIEEYEQKLEDNHEMLDRCEELLDESKTKRNDREQYWGDRESELDDLENRKIKAAKEITNETVSKLVRKYKKLIRGVKDEIEELDDEMEDVKLSMEEIDEISNKISVTKMRLKDLNGTVNPYIDQLKSMRGELEEYDDSNLDHLEKLKNHYKMLIKLLGDSKSFIRRSLINQYIPSINMMISRYLDVLDSPHKCVINNDLTVSMEYMGRSISYGNLSNGERLRLNISISMAFRELLELSGRSYNFLGIDELLDTGLDSAGFYSVFYMLKRTNNKSIFIISHREELTPEVDEIIMIEKSGGFSSIGGN